MFGPLILLFYSGTSESAFSPFGGGEFVYALPFYPLVLGQDQLGNALTMLDDEIGIGKIHQYHTYLAAVIGIYGSGCIEHCHALLCGEAASGTHLHLVAFGDLEEKTGRYHGTAERLQHYGLVIVSAYIEAGRKSRCILGKVVVAAVDYLNFHGECYLGAILYRTAAIIVYRIFGSHSAMAADITPV